MMCGLEALVVKAEAIEREEIRLRELAERERIMEEEKRERLIAYCEREINPFLQNISDSPKDWGSKGLLFIAVGGSKEGENNGVMVVESGNEYADMRFCYKPKNAKTMGTDYWGFRKPSWRWGMEDVVDLNQLKRYIETFCWEVNIEECDEGAWVYGNGYCHLYRMTFNPTPNCI